MKVRYSWSALFDGMSIRPVARGLPVRDRWLIGGGMVRVMTSILLKGT